MITHLDLFSGIGGFALAGALAWGRRHRVVCFVEKDQYCRDVLRYHYPTTDIHEDIRNFSANRYKGVFLCTGGFPCPPFSRAGKRYGTEDDRYLWPEMSRVIREAQPRWVVAENVPGLVDHGGGVVLTEIVSDLEDQGYEVINTLLPAAGVNAPHTRERLWIVARRSDTESLADHSIPWLGDDVGPAPNGAGDRIPPGVLANPIGFRRDGWENDERSPAIPRDGPAPRSIPMGSFPDWDSFGRWHWPYPVSHWYPPGTNPEGARLAAQRGHFMGARPPETPGHAAREDRSVPTSTREARKLKWVELEDPGPVIDPVRGMADGLPTLLGFLDPVKNRSKRLKALGNAIVPQVAERIFRAIQTVENDEDEK